MARYTKPVYIYIYIERERERERDRYVPFRYVYIYNINTYIRYIHMVVVCMVNLYMRIALRSMCTVPAVALHLYGTSPGVANKKLDVQLVVHK